MVGALHFPYKQSIYNDTNESYVWCWEQIKKGIRSLLQVFPPERLYLDPDCGLKTRLEDESVGKLRNVVAAAKEIRAELGID